VEDFYAERAAGGGGGGGPRVFWSSTWGEFGRERAAVQASALPAVQAAAARRGLVVTLVDLRAGYDDGDATAGRVVPLLLAEIDRCHFFTCFLGARAGCHPARYPHGPRGAARGGHEASCVALEVDRVLARRLEWGGRAFFYARDPRCADALDAAAAAPPPSADEAAEAEALRRRVAASGLGMVDGYASAEEGAAAWRGDLERALCRRHPLGPDDEHVPTGPDGWRPRALVERLEDGAHAAAFAARLAARCATAACGAAVGRLRAHVAVGGGSPVLLYGPAGCGKATALAVLLDQARRDAEAAAGGGGGGGGEGGPGPLVCGLSTRAVNTSPLRLLRTLMRTLKCHFRIDAPALPVQPAEVRRGPLRVPVSSLSLSHLSRLRLCLCLCVSSSGDMRLSLSLSLPTPSSTLSRSPPLRRWQILSHGALFAWLELAAARGPVLVALDLDGFHPDSPAAAGGGGGGGGGDDDDGDGAVAGQEDGDEEGEAVVEEGGGGADMRWLTATQPRGANVVAASSHPAALRTARELYMWPVVEMAPLAPKESEALVSLSLPPPSPSLSLSVSISVSIPVPIPILISIFFVSTSPSPSPSPSASASTPPSPSAFTSASTSASTSIYLHLHLTSTSTSVYLHLFINISSSQPYLRLDLFL
jgi:hypothetical protein